MQSCYTTLALSILCLALFSSCGGRSWVMEGNSVGWVKAEDEAQWRAQQREKQSQEKAQKAEQAKRQREMAAKQAHKHPTTTKHPHAKPVPTAAKPTMAAPAIPKVVLKKGTAVAGKACTLQVSEALTHKSTQSQFRVMDNKSDPNPNNSPLQYCFLGSNIKQQGKDSRGRDKYNSTIYIALKNTSKKEISYLKFHSYFNTGNKKGVTTSTMQKSLSKMSLKANEERIFKMESRVQFAAMKSMHLENVIFADQQRYPKLIHELSAADKKMLKWHNTAPDNDISYSFLRYHQIGNYLFPVFAIRNNSDKVISYLDGRMLVINPQGKQIDNKFLIINDRAPLLQAKQEGVLIYPHQLYSRHYPSTIKLHIIKTEVFGKRLELAK